MYNVKWYTETKEKILHEVSDKKLYVAKEDFVQEVMLALCELGHGTPDMSQLDAAVKKALNRTEPTRYRHKNKRYHEIATPTTVNAMDKYGEKIIA